MNVKLPFKLIIPKPIGNTHLNIVLFPRRWAIRQGGGGGNNSSTAPFYTDVSLKGSYAVSKYIYTYHLYTERGIYESFCRQISDYILPN